jgi:hypothetical protein
MPSMLISSVMHVFQYVYFYSMPLLGYIWYSNNFCISIVVFLVLNLLVSPLIYYLLFIICKEQMGRCFISRCKIYSKRNISLTLGILDLRLFRCEVGDKEFTIISRKAKFVIGGEFDVVKLTDKLCIHIEPKG